MIPVVSATHGSSSVRRSPVSIAQMYRRLLSAFGPQHWWPARSSFEMMAGAILTQATRWHNVKRALGRLRQAQALSPRRLVALSPATLRSCVRPAGYVRQKASRLRGFAQWYLARYDGRPSTMFRTPWPVLRDELLAVKGIGPETADAILLYAGAQPVFVIDAYTRRVFHRHHLLPASATYEQAQRYVQERLPPDPSGYNEFHALLVAVGKRYCHRRNPACDQWPLRAWPHTIEVSEHGNRQSAGGVRVVRQAVGSQTVVLS
jgi:endonuclease-3 related protein